MDLDSGLLLVTCLAIACACLLAHEEKAGWGWMIFLAFLAIANL